MRFCKSPKVCFAAAALLAAVAACPLVSVVRADQPMMAGMADDPAKTAAMKQMTDAKMMAADPAQSAMMAKDMAKMMVMDHMAEMLAKDEACKQACMAAMSDPAMMKVHEQAAAMAKDPEQMKKLQDEIAADPASMKMVMHESMQMSKPMGMMPDAGKMGRDMKDGMKHEMGNMAHDMPGEKK